MRNKSLLLILIGSFLMTNAMSQITIVNGKMRIGHPSDQVIELHDKSNFRGEKEVTIYGLHDESTSLKGWATNINDEVKAIKFVNTLPGTKIKLYDDPNGRNNDDYVEIVVKRKLKEATINNLERSFENANFKVLYHSKNGLNGKVSYLKIEKPLIESGFCIYEINIKANDPILKNCKANVHQRFNADLDYNFEEVVSLAEQECKQRGLVLDPDSTINMVDCNLSNDGSKVINYKITAFCSCK